MSAYAAENRLRRWFTGEEHTNMKLTIPSNAEKILHILEENGYEAYVVGGCVRDSILGRNPNDWDITTSASPQQVKELFQRTVDTGLQHGTVTVLMDKEGYEVTTYRVDGDYEDGRHPKQVMFTSSLEEDLKRRDFTINAMAYHPERGLVDLFHGMEDMEHKIVRCVGDPMERFHEDALRILRAVRFSAQLGFTIEEKTKAGIQALAPNLKCVSAERIQTELVKLLVSPHPDYLRVAYETGITREFLPEFDACMETEQNTPHHCYTVGEHILHGLLLVRPDKVLRLTMLLHDIVAVFFLCCPFSFFRLGFLWFLRGCFFHRAMVSVQNFFFSFKPHVHITGGNSFKVHGKPKRRADTRKRMSQDFANRIEVACQLVHIGRCRMS